METLNYSEDVKNFLEDLCESEKEKVSALLKNLPDAESIHKCDYDDNVYIIDGDNYKILDDDEREEEVTEYIKNSLWTFNPSFLASMTDYDLLPVYVTLVDADLCEGANDAVLALVEKYNTLEHFVESVVLTDGYGHFLSSCDGEEIELENDYFAYRI